MVVGTAFMTFWNRSAFIYERPFSNIIAILENGASFVNSNKAGLMTDVYLTSPGNVFITQHAMNKCQSEGFYSQETDECGCRILSAVGVP